METRVKAKRKRKLNFIDVVAGLKISFSKTAAKGHCYNKTNMACLKCHMRLVFLFVTFNESWETNFIRRCDKVSDMRLKIN